MADGVVGRLSWDDCRKCINFEDDNTAENICKLGIDEGDYYEFYDDLGTLKCRKFGVRKDGNTQS